MGFRTTDPAKSEDEISNWISHWIMANSLTLHMAETWISKWTSGWISVSGVALATAITWISHWISHQISGWISSEILCDAMPLVFWQLDIQWIYHQLMSCTPMSTWIKDRISSQISIQIFSFD